MKQVTKEIFIQFLKDNDFYDAWMNAYDLDNELYQEIVSLDKFFENSSPTSWMYYGISAMSFSPNYKDENLNNIITDWRKKNLTKWISLDDKWNDFVNN